MATSVKEYFQTLDFIIFFGFFFISLGVGSLFAYRDRRKSTIENYYFGERELSPIAVAISIAVSYISAVTLIGVPAEVYLYGNAYALHPVAVLIADAISIIYFIPLFHKLKMTSMFEYLELRFHRSVRMIVSGLEVISNIIYMATATFVPALALDTVTPLNLTWTIALTSLTCTVYTSLGGMKAVIWTDVLQSSVMIGGMLAMFIYTVNTLGGFGAVQETALLGGRNTILKLDGDPRVKTTAWSMVFGTLITASYSLICSQIFVQRWLSCKTVKNARIAVSLSFIPLALLSLFSVLNGWVAYAYFENCDPLLSGKLTKPDQIVPLMAVYVFQEMPGMAGLFVSAAFCGTLSTVSSGINGLAAMILSDFVGVKYPDLSERSKIVISKALTTFLGILVMILAYLISLSSTNALGIVLTTSGLFAGPIVAIFIMAVFMPWINYKGALIGCCFSFAFLIWIALSAMVMAVDKSGWEPLPRSIDNCTTENDFLRFHNATTVIPTTLAANDSELLEEKESISLLGRTLFAISPYFYGLFGVMTSVIASHIASIFVGFRKPSREGGRFSVPLVRCCLLPAPLRNYFVYESKESNGSSEGGELRSLKEATE